MTTVTIIENRVVVTPTETTVLVSIIPNIVTVDVATGATSFLGLNDTPDSYIGQSLKSIRVNASETGLEFVVNASVSIATPTVAGIVKIDAIDLDPTVYLKSSVDTLLGAKLSISSYDWSTLPNKPSTFAPSAHTHSESEVTGIIPPSKGGTGVNNGANLLTVPAIGIAALLATNNLFTVRQDIRASGSGIAAALHVPWITGDALPAIVGGSATAGANVVGISGLSSSSAGVQGFSSTGDGVRGVGGGTPIHARRDGSNTNTIGIGAIVNARTSGTPIIANFGISLRMRLQSSTAVDQDAGEISALWTDAAHATRTSAVTISTVAGVAGVAPLIERARFDANGLTLNGALTMGGFTVTLSKTGTLPVGTGTAGRMAEWVTDANTIRASTLAKTGAGVLTLSVDVTQTWKVVGTSLGIGLNALNAGVGADGNLAFGNNTLPNLTSGGLSIAIGASAGASLSSGLFNTFIGANGGLIATSMNNSTGVGYGVMILAAATSQRQSAFGQSAGSNLSGDDNAVFGFHAGTYQSGQSVVFGASAADNAAATGNGNVFLGFEVAKNETGSNLLYIENSSSARPLIGGNFATDTLTFNATDAATSGIRNTITIDYKSGDTPTPGTGIRTSVALRSTTADSQLASDWVTRWGIVAGDATGATRRGEIIGTVYDTAAREWIRGKASGAAPMIGFLGAAAVVRQTLSAAAIDPATTQTLANDLRTAIINLGLAA